MAESSFTQTGVNELRAAIMRFPADQTAALRRVAETTAKRVQTKAQALLLSRESTEAHALADAIGVTEDAANRAFLVASNPPARQPSNITLWNEYGTVNMDGRHYMHDSATGETEQYRRDMESASERAARGTFGA